jgi:hypothetical protein
MTIQSWSLMALAPRDWTGHAGYAPPTVHGEEAADASREDAHIAVAVAFPSVPERGVIDAHLLSASPEARLQRMRGARRPCPAYCFLRAVCARACDDPPLLGLRIRAHTTQALVHPTMLSADGEADCASAREGPVGVEVERPAEDDGGV